jgi:hypothetical protein
MKLESIVPLAHRLVGQKDHKKLDNISGGAYCCIRDWEQSPTIASITAGISGAESALVSPKRRDSCYGQSSC